MAIYKNPKSLFESAQIDDASHTGFFFVKNEADVEPAKDMLKAAGQQVLTQTSISGKTAIITRSPHSRENAFAKLAEYDGGKYEEAKPEKLSFLQFLRKHGWKLRGGSSVVGQSMTLFSAFKSVSKADADAGRLNPKFDPATGAFATLNLAANFVNYVFGGQKEKDKFGLEKFNDVIADEVNRYTPNGATKISAGDVKKVAYMDAKEKAEYDKSNSPVGILKRNSVRLGEVGLRTLGSICMVFNYRKVLPALALLAKGEFKNAFMTAKVQDKGTFMAGIGMVSGKIMGLLAKTYDPNNPPKTYFEELRQKVFWITSSFTEMIAQSSVAYDRYKNKRLVLGGKVHQDMTGIVGNIILTVPPYPTRLVLPYGKKVLDTDEVQARMLDEMPKLPADKIPEVAARVTARMVEHMGEGEEKFAELYTQALAKLNKFHHIAITPANTVAPAKTDDDVPMSNFAVKVAKSPTPRPKKTDAIQNILNPDTAANEQGAAVAMR